MLASLFALRGNPAGLEPEVLVESVCKAAQLCHQQLTDNQRLLVKNFINTYSPVEPDRLTQIKEKYQMYYAPTLESHIAYVEEQAKQEGKLEGRQEGKLEGLREGEEKGIQKGIKKGLQEGIQKGKLEGKLEGLREGKLEVIALLEALGKLSKTEAESMRAHPLR